MSLKADDILEELYLIDPSLRDEEEALKKTIKELLESKPAAEMDELFAARLKEKLLAEFSKKARPERAKRGFLLAKPAFRIALAAVAAASAIFAVYIGRVPAPAVVTTGTGLPSAIGAPANREAPAAATAPEAAAQTAAAQTAAAQTAARPATAAPSVAAPAEKPDAARDKDEAERLAPAPIAAASERQEESKGLASGELSRALARGQSAPAPAFAPSGPPSAKAKKAASPIASLATAKQAAGSTAGSAADSTAAPASSMPELPYDDSADVLVDRYRQDFDTEGYDRIVESSFAKVLEEPLSTFSIDVDTASYANVRRFLRSGSLPPPDAVRIEELVNYFPYDYAGPSGEEPFAFDSELSPCPWNPSHSLLRIALQAKRIDASQMPPSNLVFLVDVSGSMDEENKLPLVKEALKTLARRMRQEDRISIVVYAGSAGIVLEPTPGSKTQRILKAIDDLEAGGSTAGGEGIVLAYEAARKAFIPKGSNRVILATDGDFNIGASSDGELVRLIEEKRKAGIFLTVLGFGMGNYKDSKMQKLADSGNGNYAYIDALSEADKVLSRQMAGTLFTVAKDVKVQVEFNPALVGEYRLIGYEKRALAARDFADDSKDAGELGAGSSVTALYELVPPGASPVAGSRGELRYQSTAVTAAGAKAAELMTLKFRYKRPDGSESSLVERPVELISRDISACSADFRFAAAVAEWGLVLRQSAYKGDASAEQALSLARGAIGRDPGGYRAEFLDLVRLSRRLGR